MGLAAIAMPVMGLGFSLARFVIGILLFSAPLPRRNRFGLRMVATLVALLLVYAALSAFFLGMSGPRSGPFFYASQFNVYSMLLLALVAATVFVYDTNLWTALFCCSAGYTVENLASGATELVWTIIGGGSVQSGAYQTPPRYAVAFLCTAIVFVATYLLVTRRLIKGGLHRIEDRSMLVMMAVTILVIIGFDLLIKGLTEQGLSLDAVVLLRCFHGLACVFTLSMEFQLLITSRAEAQRDTMERVLAEHERQYEAARESVAAVNARMHDIRHNIARIADADGLSRESIRELVREVTVYDSHVRTGNEALDTALTERRLSLGRAGVALTCVADGAALSFMAPADTYALFCALLDAVADTGATSASLVVRETLGTTSVHVETNGTAANDALLRPVAEVARRNGGTLTTLAQDGAFHVNLLFPAQ